MMIESQDLKLAVPHSACRCGCSADTADPELDARAIPHAIRHAAVFGVLDSIGIGSAIVLLAPHDPLPLLSAAQQRYGGPLTVEYLERGPQVWRLRLLRTA